MTGPVLRGGAVVLACVALAGCSSGDGGRTSAPAGAAATTSAPPSSAPVTTPPATTRPPAGPSTPATTAGALDSRNVPQPPDLGPGWNRYVDPGRAEEGYLGNGSWVRARNNEDVVAGIVPIGCLGLTEAPRLPVPVHALEATYRGPGGAPAVALALDYRTVTGARDLVRGMGRIAGSCPAPREKVRREDPLVVVVTAQRVTADLVLDRRREHGTDASPWVWSEAVVRQGTRVGLLIVASPPGAPAPDLSTLAASLRAAVVRSR